MKDVMNAIFTYVAGSCFSCNEEEIGDFRFEEDDEESMTALLKDKDYYKRLIITEMKSDTTRYGFLRCLRDSDIDLFVDKMIDLLMANNHSEAKIEEILRSGLMPFEVWQIIMKHIAPSLKHSYILCAMCMEDGSPLPEHLINIARWGPIKNVVIINTYEGSKSPDKSGGRYYILYTPGHIESIMCGIPQVPNTSLERFIDYKCVVD